MPSPSSDLSFEAAMQALNQVLSELESGNLPLDQLLAHYERGSELIQICQAKLKAVEQQIQTLDNLPTMDASE